MIANKLFSISKTDMKIRHIIDPHVVLKSRNKQKLTITGKLTEFGLKNRSQARFRQKLKIQKNPIFTKIQNPKKKTFPNIEMLKNKQSVLRLSTQTTPGNIKNVTLRTENPKETDSYIKSEI